MFLNSWFIARLGWGTNGNIWYARIEQRLCRIGCMITVGPCLQNYFPKATLNYFRKYSKWSIFLNILREGLVALVSILKYNVFQLYNVFNGNFDFFIIIHLSWTQGESVILVQKIILWLRSYPKEVFGGRFVRGVLRYLSNRYVSSHFKLLAWSLCSSDWQHCFLGGISVPGEVLSKRLQQQ